MLKIKKFLISAFSLSVVAAFLSAAIQAKVKPAPIEDLIKQSQLIVVGKVTSINKIEGVDFANVEIVQTLKGASYENIFYSAERTWACDMSRAVDGETAVFFFNKYIIKPALLKEDQSPIPFQKTVSFKEAVERLVDTTDLFRLTFDGRGRMPIQEISGNKQLQIGGGVILPEDLKPELNEVINYTNRVLSND